MSDKIVFLRSISRFVLLVFLLLSMVWISFTKSIGHASLMNTPKASANNLTSLHSDVNGDGVVDILDFTLVAIAWNSRPQDPKWNPKLDLNADGVVNILDMVLVLKDLGQSIGTERVLKHLVVYPYTFTDEEASFVASHFDLVDVDFGATIGFEKIKALNPNVTIVGYKCLMSVNTYDEDWAEVNLHEDWFLHDLNGKRLKGNGDTLSGYAMDVGNSGWRIHYANFVKAKLNAYTMVDGIFADNAWEWYDYRSDHFTVDRSLVPQEIQRRWHNDTIGMIQYVKSVIGSKLLIINSNEYGGDYLKYCDGQTIEGFMHAQWKGLYDYSGNNPIYENEILKRFSASGKIVMAQSGAEIPQNPSPSDVEQTHKVMLYCLSGFLMGYDGNASFGFQSLHGDYTGHRSYWEEMDAPIGNPKGRCYQVEGSLYARDFDSGKAFLNIDDYSSYNITVAGKSYTLEPRSGLIIPF